MTRLVLALGLCVVIAGCSSGMTPSDGASSPGPAGSTPPPSVRSPLPETPPPAPTSNAALGPGRLVAYGYDDAVWVVNADGTNAHELIAGLPGSRGPLAWSRDGSRLLYGTQRGVALTDAAGSEPVELELPCPPAADSDPVLFICEADVGDVALSPDGTRLAYPIREGTHDQANTEVAATLVILDLATGFVTRLHSTRAVTPSLACGDAATQGDNHSPSWSPDGTRLIFVREAGGAAPDGPCSAVLTVSVDGSDVRQVVAPGQLRGRLEARWSPDGSRILLDGFDFRVNGTQKQFETDVYSVRSDGTGLQALTTGGVSSEPSWTRDGRVAFTRWLSPASSSRGDLWVMDADGGNASKLGANLRAMTEAGCVTCPYPLPANGMSLDELETSALERFGGEMAMLWQPVQGGQP